MVIAAVDACAANLNVPLLIVGILELVDRTDVDVHLNPRRQVASGVSRLRHTVVEWVIEVQEV